MLTPIDIALTFGNRSAYVAGRESMSKRHRKRTPVEKEADHE